MNSHLKINIIISLFIFSCTDDKIQIISNTLSDSDLPDPNYKLNLQSNSGEKLDSVKISWNDSGNDVSLINLSTEKPVEQSGNLTGLTPGDFLDIEISTIKDDSTYKDIIQIFTRVVYPVTIIEFIYEIVYDTTWEYQTNWDYTFDTFGVKLDSTSTIDTTYDTIEKYHRTLTWSPSIENTVIGYNIYRESVDNITNLIDPIETSYIDHLTNKLDTSYTDLHIKDNPGEFAYYYRVQVITESGYKRTSIIYKYSDFNQPGPIQLAEGNVSTDKDEYIKIAWDPITGNDSTYFYQYEIWRAPDEEKSDTLIIAIIPEPQINHFMDRNAGNGTTWYYSVVVVDINGREKPSNFIPGWSMP